MPKPSCKCVIDLDITNAIMQILKIAPRQFSWVAVVFLLRGEPLTTTAGKMEIYPDLAHFFGTFAHYGHGRLSKDVHAAVKWMIREKIVAKTRGFYPALLSLIHI